MRPSRAEASRSGLLAAAARSAEAWSASAFGRTLTWSRDSSTGRGFGAAGGAISIGNGAKARAAGPMTLSDGPVLLAASIAFNAAAETLVAAGWGRISAVTAR